MIRVRAEAAKSTNSAAEGHKTILGRDNGTITDKLNIISKELP